MHKAPTAIKNYFPIEGMDETSVLDHLASDFCQKDYSYDSGNILNSICTSPLPVAIKAFVQAIESNLGDKRIFKGIAELEKVTTMMIGDLLGNPLAVGNVVSGGTEANLLAMICAKNKNQQIKKPEIILPYSAHFSFDKIMSMLSITPKFIQLRSDLRADTTKIRDLISENTIALVGSAGTSEAGIIDPLEEMSGIASEYNLHFHIDAASGGFIVPFARDLGYPLPQCDFKLPRINSITIDPHKYGLSVIPSGYILFNSDVDQNYVKFESHYINTVDHTTFLGTRSGAGLASCYAVIKYLGKAGFNKIVKSYFDRRDFFIRLLEQNGFEIAYPADLNIVLIKCSDAINISQLLQEKNWIISISKRYSVLRIVIANHVTEYSLSRFVNDLKEIESRK